MQKKENLTTNSVLCIHFIQMSRMPTISNSLLVNSYVRSFVHSFVITINLSSWDGTISMSIYALHTVCLCILSFLYLSTDFYNIFHFISFHCVLFGFVLFCFIGFICMSNCIRRSIKTDFEKQFSNDWIWKCISFSYALDREILLKMQNENYD